MNAKQFWTFQEADQKIRRDLDIVDDPMVSQATMIELFNDAIRTIAAHMRRLHCDDDYFLTSTPIAMVLGQDIYDLPENIYANKIRSMVYSEGLSLTYEVHAYHRYNKFGRIQFDNLNNVVSNLYKYYLRDDDPDTNAQLVLVPAAQINSATNLTMWYTRQPNRIVNINDKIDIPEFISYIFSHVKKSILKKKKEFGEDEAKDFDAEEILMLSTLKNQTDDNMDEPASDISHYAEHV